MEIEWETRQWETRLRGQSRVMGWGLTAQWRQPECMAWSGGIYGLGYLAVEPHGRV